MSLKERFLCILYYKRSKVIVVCTMCSILNFPVPKAKYIRVEKPKKKNANSECVIAV